MRHRTQTQQYGWIKLVKKTNPKTGRKHYSVTVSSLDYTGGYGWEKSKLADAWRQHFDPAGNRGQKYGLSWKFKTKEEAEQLITLALLKWGERYVA